MLGPTFSSISFLSIDAVGSEILTALHAHFWGSKRRNVGGCQVRPLTPDVIGLGSKQYATRRVERTSACLWAMRGIKRRNLGVSQVRPLTQKPTCFQQPCGAWFRIGVLSIAGVVSWPWFMFTTYYQPNGHDRALHPGPFTQTA